MKKFLVLLLAALGAVAASAKTHTLVKKWETEATLKVPESVLYDAKRDVLFVSNIDGQPWGDDNQGSIGKVGLDGKVIAVDWVRGLSAPKGLGVHNNLLYAADIDRVVVIDIEKGVIVNKIAVAGAHGLNDVSIDRKGVVYVSDSKDKKIYAIKDGKAAVVIEGLTAPNGVHVRDGELYFMDNGSLCKLGKQGERQLVNAGMEGNGDGLESVSDNEFVVSYWQGVLHYLNSDGTRETLLDSSADKINSADIGYDKKRRILYVPTFFKNSIVAYEVK